MPNPLPPNIKPAFPRPCPPAAVADQLRQLLGLDSMPEKVAATTRSTQEMDELIRTDVRYPNSLGESLQAVILTPRTIPAAGLPGVVCMHGTSGSIDHVVAEQLELSPPPYPQLRGWARALSRRGYATISISLKGSVQRRGSVEAWEEEAKLLEAYGRPHAGIVAEEALLAARVIGAHPGVDPQRLALTGMSLGGFAAWYGMACAPWIAVGAPICGGVGSLARVIHQGNVERHSSLIFPPHLLRYFDHADIVAAAIAPRPFMMVAPLEDEDMPKAGVDDLLPPVQDAYRRAGLSKHFQIHRPEGNHVFKVEFFEWLVAWFRRFL